MIFMYMLMIKNLNNMNYIYPKKLELNKLKIIIKQVQLI